MVLPMDTITRQCGFPSEFESQKNDGFPMDSPYYWRSTWLRQVLWLKILMYIYVQVQLFEINGDQKILIFRLC